MIYRFDPEKQLIERQIPAAFMAIFSQTRQCWTELDKLGTLWQAIKAQVMERDGWRCVECKTNRGIDVYHIVPIKSGGSNLGPNLRVYCRQCERTKAQGKRNHAFRFNTERSW